MHAENISKLNNLKGRISRDNEWEVIKTKTRGIGHGATDIVSGRITENKTSTYSISLSIGIDILELCSLKIGDRLLPFRSRLNSTLIKLALDNGGDGYKLTKNENSSRKIYLKMNLPSDKKYLCDIKRELNFDISEKSLILDLEPLIKK